MALGNISSASTSLYSPLQSTGCSFPCCPTGTSAINNASLLVTRSPSTSLSSEIVAQFRHPSSSSLGVVAQFRHPSSSSSSSAASCSGDSRSQGWDRGPRSNGGGARGTSSLTSEFLSTDLWNRRIVGRRPGQHFASKRVLQVRAARMESGAVKVGFRAPDFELPEPLTGKTCKLDDFEDQQALLVMFICNHCPFVIHLKESIAKFAQEFQLEGLGVVAISSNSVVSHPQDGPKFMAEDAKKFGYVFPYLYDETQEVAKSFGAVCTPDFFLFKKDGRRPFELAYHGRYDETRPGSKSPVTGQDLRAAVTAILKGLPVGGAQKPSIGCSIKWHPGK